MLFVQEQELGVVLVDFLQALLVLHQQDVMDQEYRVFTVLVIRIHRHVKTTVQDVYLQMEQEHMDLHLVDCPSVEQCQVQQ
jgi:hypothetical protein